MSCAQVDALTLKEYDWLMEAYGLRRVDEDYRVHQLAYVSVAAGATNKSGKPVYRDFRKFYDYEDEQKKALGMSQKKDRFAGLKAYMRGDANG